MLKPIPQHQNYFFTSKGRKKIYGFSEDRMTKAIDIIDQDGDELNLQDFFTKNGELYFTISTMVKVDNPKFGEENEPEKITEEQLTYFKQDKSGTIKELTTKTTRPTLNRVQLENGEFTIKNYDYKGTLCSDVNNEKMEETGLERFLLVDGYSHYPGVGLYFNIAEGRPKVRKSGLAFWPLSSTKYMYIKLPKGEIW